ncbi:MAG TPA: vWA domain-containing protein [Polyangiaceae bacterium]|nr:vWA domain-containing protein [Polyangiaceae bacterium]
MALARAHLEESMQPWNKRRAYIATAAIALGAAGFFVSACGGGAEKGKAASSARPCDDELKALCETPCDTTTTCPSGLYCFSGKCTADCTQMGGQCSGGTCTADGHCLMDTTPALGGGGPPGSGSGGSTAINPGMGPGCIQQGVEFESVTPTVVLLVDRSGSMTADFGAKDRWNTIRDILVDPMTGFVKQLEAKVRFGLALYTGIKAQAADPMAGTPAVAGSCPDLIVEPEMFNNYQKIHDTFMAHEVGDDTPTAESLALVTQGLVAYPEVGPKYIVLATDGDPDTCAAPDSNGTQPPRDMSLMAVQDAWNQHISTFVISVGPEATTAHLQALAEAGQGGAMGAHFFPANDANMLAEAFGSILHGVISCDITLNGTVESANAPSGYITLDNVAVPYADPNGWILSAPDTVTLQGDSCSKLQLTGATVNIAFPCGTVNIR